ncbi:MAG: glycoside hydrolase family 30 beta sandwich domain-containing protein [Halarsenatibacteraceae bacterium]
MSKYIKIIETAKDTDARLTEKESLQFNDFESINQNKPVVELDNSKKYQKILGFGGAFTEAAAHTLFQISPDKRKEVIESYFNSETGLGYSLGRVHIHSCDFALENYTYVEENDEKLETFDISRDKEKIIPLIKDAIAERGDKLKLLASPWSPPAWMKTNNEMNNGGKLLPEYREAWAKYFTKFIKAYREEGIDIWGISVQNEPEAVQTWDSCIYTPEEERDFVKFYLGPIMERKDLEDVKILICDHNRDIIVKRASAVFSDREAASYVWGAAFHWYVSEEFENVGRVHELYPEKHLLFTEGCQEGGVKLGEWFTGERYGRNMIGDLNNWTEGYLDWNLVLNEKGGPNHVGNYCDAPIIADTEEDKLHYNSSYYYIGHFSKYIKQGARRIDWNSDLDDLNMTAFENPDSSIALVVMNETDRDHQFILKEGSAGAEIESLAHSIKTIII